MTNGSSVSPKDRKRIGWWLFVGLVTVVAGYLVYSTLGLIVLGVFGYYATRPICRRVHAEVESDRFAAIATVLLVLVPIALVTLSAGFTIFQRVQGLLGSSGDPLALFSSYVNIEGIGGEQRGTLQAALGDPRRLLSQPRDSLQTLLDTGITVVSAITGTLLFLALAITLSYFLLEHDEQLGSGLTRLFGGRDTIAYNYAVAVDQDLESVFFGNLLFVVVMSVIAAITYSLTNLIAPEGVRVPMVLTLAFLTGVASLVPIVVGKLVYVPVVGYLFVQAVDQGGSPILFVAGVLVVYFVVLDILPQTLLQPYLSGQKLDMMVLMFGYLLGPILFGWYGFFLLPIVFIVIIELVRIPLPELIHGEELTPDTSMAESIGAKPRQVRDDVEDEREQSLDEAGPDETDIEEKE